MDISEDKYISDDEDLSASEVGSSESEEGSSGDEDDDDYETEEEEEVVEGLENEDNGNTPETNNNLSDDDPERESCPVCLNKFIGQDLGTPASCEHTFCYDCIQEWSKNINTCPIDRTEFNYIQMRAIPGGPVIKKVKVKVLPKEPEDTLQESVTVCEICHSGDREDRLLLCDGCDLAYHCECLDPPLFYIPIEEWFCPPCSGVLDNRPVAGPSYARRRRIIPRTRASETVRSRVQNIRSGGTARPTSQSRKTSLKRTPKKRRRVYRKAVKKVVTLARTKKDMNSGQKGKMGARGSTIIITYGRRKKYRKRKRSRKSVASSKAIPIPSAQQRIAKRLGISKQQGSKAPQVKQPVGGRVRSSALKDKKTSHSLFGNKDELMDFSENFNEDTRNIPSTSSSFGRPSTDIPSTSSVNILDSIMAGQKILHSKSENIVIKTDGSLILKEKSSVVKKTDNLKKAEVSSPSHTPMNIALAKPGVRLSLPDKNQNSSWKKHADASKTKNNLKNTTSKPQTVNSKNENKVSTKQFKSASPSNLKLNFSGDNKQFSLNKTNQRKTEQRTLAFTNSSNSCKSNDKNNCGISATRSLPSGSISNNSSSNLYTKKEVLSDDETNSDSTIAENVPIKKEVLSDDETNVDCWNSNSNNVEEDEGNNIITSIKKEPVDLNLERGKVANKINFNIQGMNTSSRSSENDLSDLDESQSIIDSVPPDTFYSSKIDKSDKNVFCIKVKEEILSDNEEYSQSLILSDVSDNLHNASVSKSSLLLKEEPCNSDSEEDKKKSKEKSRNNYDYSMKPVGKRRVRFSSNVSDKGRSSPEEDEGIPCTQAAPSIAVNSGDHLPCTQAASIPFVSKSEDDDLPCTQAVTSPTDSESDDDDLPCTQAVTSPTDSECDNDLPCTQAAPTPTYSESEDDLPCTQAVSTPIYSAHKDDLPLTQAVSTPVYSEHEDNLSCTQAAPTAIYSEHENDLPCTQAITPPIYSERDDDLPCTQPVCLPSKNKKSFFDKKLVTATNSNIIQEKDTDLPSTQSIAYENNTNINILDDNLPPTQTHFEFVRPASVSKSNKCNKQNPKASTGQKSPKEKSSSSGVVTFFAPSSKNKSNSDPLSTYSKSKQTTSFSNNQDVDINDDLELPPTQVSNQNIDLSDTGDVLNCDLEMPHLIPSKDKNAHEVQHFEVSSKKKKILHDLPATQALDTSREQNFLDICNTVKTRLSTLSSSEVLDNVAKETVDSDNIDETENSLPATQISNLVSEKTSDVNESLPATQILNSVSKETYDVDESLPATQTSNSISKKMSDVDEADDNATCENNLSKILSNIKQIVNSLSVKDPEDVSLQNIESGNDIDNNYSNCSAEKANASDESADSENSKDVPLKNNHDVTSCINKKNISGENMHSSSGSENEELSLEKIKESLKKQPKATTPKKIGIHKHLPQVITTIPVKEHLKIKPSNRKTFSFEEVAKLEKPVTEQEISKSIVQENSMNSWDNSLPATQKIEDVNSRVQINESVFTTKFHNPRKENNEQFTDRLSKKIDFLSFSNLNKLHVVNDDDLPETQVANCVKDDCDLSKTKTSFHVKDSKVSSNTSLNDEDSLPDTQIGGFNYDKDFLDALEARKKEVAQLTDILRSKHSAQSKKVKTSVIDTSVNRTKSSIQKEKKMSFELPEFEDLPATQLCNNVPVETLNEIHKPSKSHTINNALKRSLENYEDSSKSVNDDEGISTKKIKLENGKFDLIQNLEKLSSELNAKKQRINSVSLDCEKELSCEIINSLKANNSNKIVNQKGFNSIDHATIKQEKVDFEFAKPLIHANVLNSNKQVSCLNLNVVKIKTENSLDDFLPSTQVANADLLDNDFLPPTQVVDFNQMKTNLLSNENSTQKDNENIILLPSQIKKEPCSGGEDDDEITVIAVDPPPETIIKEEIVIDDDGNSITNVISDSVKCKQESSHEIIGIPSIKKEKYVESISIVPSVSIPAEKISNVCAKCKMKACECLEKNEKRNKIKSKETNFSKNDSKKSKDISSKKGNLNSTDNIRNSKKSNSIEEINRHHTKDLFSKEERLLYSKDFKFSKEESRKHSQDSNSFKEKNKQHSNNFNSSKKERSLSKDSILTSDESKGKSKDSNSSKEKSKRFSKDSHPSKEECRSYSKDTKLSKDDNRKHTNDSDFSKGKRSDSKDSKLSRHSNESNSFKEESRRHPEFNSSEEKSRLSSKSKSSKEENKRHSNESKSSKEKNTRHSNESKSSKEESRRHSNESKSSKESKRHSNESNSSKGSRRHSNESNSFKEESRRHTPESNSSIEKSVRLSNESNSFKEKSGRLSHESNSSKEKRKHSKDSDSSKESRRHSKDSYFSEEQICKIPNNSHDSKEKCRRNFDDILSSKEKKERKDKSSILEISHTSLQNDLKHSKHTQPTQIQKHANDSSHENKEFFVSESLHTKYENNQDENESVPEKQIEPFAKEKRYYPEKENKDSLCNETKDKEIVITLKSSHKKRRPSENSSNHNSLKKMKYDHTLDSASCSSEDIHIDLTNIQNSLSKHANSLISLTPQSDIGMENIDVLNTKSVMESPKSPAADIKKIFSKQDLKEEIATEVKLVLKPFYSASLISKDDYKDIMRKAVPKIFMNCHNCINPEKIRKLVLGYVSLLSKS